MAEAASVQDRASAPVAVRVLALAVALACALAALWLARHHPLSPLLAAAGVLGLGAAQAAWPPFWLVALPAAMPWLGLGAWSGWLIAEETDLAVLAVAAGGYLRLALRPGPAVPASRASRRQRAWGVLLGTVWVASVLVAMHRGALDAGGWAPGWWQGLREPLNALRLAKPTLAALLLLPLWWWLQQRPGQRTADQLGLGMTLALAGITLWCLWERATGPGLLNMATDYRTTGPFWETHTGGAALDISLALCFPFALRLAWTAGSPLALAAAGAVVLGGVYAGLTTFSRIVYLALPVGALLYAVLQLRQDAAMRPDAGKPGTGRTGAHPLAAPALCLGAGALAAWVFPVAGYRGMLALLGCMVTLLLLVPRGAALAGRTRAGAWVLGGVAGAVVAPLALFFGKGAYVAYALAAVGTVALLVQPAGGTARPMLAGAGFLVQLACMVAVGRHWGGDAAVVPTAGAALALALAWAVLGHRQPPPWPTHPRWLGGTGAGLVMVLTGVAVFGGGDYMAGRFAQSEVDRVGRWDHFRDGLSLNDGGTARWLGQGLGRYADLYALHGRVEERPGDVRLVEVQGAPVVRMVAGNHPMGFGNVLRLSQRIPAPPGLPLTVRMQLRADKPVKLRAEVCVKHLLYVSDCRAALGMSTPVVAPPGEAGATQAASVPNAQNAQHAPQATQVPQAAAKAAEPQRQTWQFALSAPQGVGPGDALPRIVVFAVASETPRQPLDLLSVSLTDSTGHEYLHNGRFSDGLARWFMTSDRNHLPWHAKNMAVHLLVEQGVLGLVSLVVLTVAALAGLAGPLRAHPLAPALLAALVGCWVVGAVDSVLDMPRVATWLLLFTGMALSLHLPSRAPARPARPR